MKMQEQARGFFDGLKVRQKGLLLISIPLAFQLLFTLSLGLIYAEAEKEAWKESRARMLAIKTNALIKDMWDAGEIMLAYQLTQDKAILNAWTSKRAAVLESLDSLKKLSWERKDFDHQFSSMQNLSNQGIVMLDNTMASFNTVGVGTSTIFSDVKPFMDALAKEVEGGFTRDAQQQANALKREEQSRKNISYLLYASVVADFAIALLLSAIFASSIAGRLSVVTENTNRAKERKPLNPALKGDDEIADLDKQFHQLVDALSESERLRSEFLSMTSHDLKTPLMSVELSLELISRQLTEQKLEGSVFEELTIAKENMHRVLALINDLLDLERGATGKLNLELEELQIDYLIEKSCRSVSPLAERKKIELLHHKLKDDSEVIADRRRIEQVLVNLLGNALKFSPADSRVEIRSNIIAGKQIEIRISDSGSGIAEADRQRIFDRFEQAGALSAGADKGTGLGLAICKTIVLAHGGEIGVSENQKKGSDFWFTLPLAES